MDLAVTPTNPVPPGAVTGWVTTPDGVRLRYAVWRALRPTGRGTVCLFQGRSECIEKYFEVVGELRARGFAVATLDWRGQGGSDRLLGGDRRRGHVERFTDYDLDLDTFMRQVALPDTPPPHYALAHSMGGLVCLRAAGVSRTRFARMVLVAPMLQLSRETSPPMAAVRLITGLATFCGLGTRRVPRADRHAIDRLAFPGNPLTGSPDRFARTKATLHAAPGLALGSPSNGWTYAAARAMQAAAAPDFAASIGVPVLLVAAGRDHVVSTEAIERLSNQLRAGAHVVIPGARHEILMEEDPLRELFWAAFDAFVPGSDTQIATGGASPGEEAEHFVMEPGVAARHHAAAAGRRSAVP